MATLTKDPITCHVLDTLTGRPAPNMSVTLRCHPEIPPSTATGKFTATTNSDGRISNWTTTDDKSVAELVGEPETGTIWTLTFDTARYYGGLDKTFWPVVTLTFMVKKGEHYHVPLLLGPYSYTTYRGS